MLVKDLKLDNDLKTQLFIDKNGRVITGTYKALMKRYGVKGLSWSNMHKLRCSGGLTKEEHNFFKGINVETTIFNVANLREYGFFHIYPLILKKSNLLNNDLVMVEE